MANSLITATYCTVTIEDQEKALLLQITNYTTAEKNSITRMTNQVIAPSEEQEDLRAGHYGYSRH